MVPKLINRAGNSIYVVTDPQQLAKYQQILGDFQKTFDPTPLGKWQLEYSVLKSTSSGPEDTKPPRFQYVFWNSKNADRLFSVVQPPARDGDKEPRPMAIAAMASHYREEWYAVLMKMAALWTRPVTMAVPDGIAYEVGEFTWQRHCPPRP